MPVIVSTQKPGLPTLWLDTSVVIKLAKLKLGVHFQELEARRLTRLRDLVIELVRAGRLICPEADQDEEYVGTGGGDEIVHRLVMELSHGISLRHREGILENQIFKGMQSYIKNSDAIDLPTSIYFHGDPVEELEEARTRDYIIGVGPLKSPEILTRRAENKKEINRKWEELRLELVAKGQTFEAQLEKEIGGYWDGMVGIITKFEENLRSGRSDAYDFIAATVPMTYKTVWDKMRGEPAGSEGLNLFFHSAHFAELPSPFASCRLNAELLTGNEPIVPGDEMDVALLSVALAVSHYVVADKRMSLRIKKLGLDSKYDAQVFSMSTIDDLFVQLERLK
jgi:hypothetical protein